jgi:AraC-like DNA-binding protein
MSQVLSLVRLRGDLVCACDFSTPWSLGLQGPMCHFHIVERGSLWLIVDNGTRLQLGTGDLVILPRGHGHSLASDPALDPVPIAEFIAENAIPYGAVHRIGHGDGDTHMVCGRFSFASPLAPRLLTVLPPLIHIDGRHGLPLEWLQLTARFLVSETRNPRPASKLMIERLLELTFILALREWGAKSEKNLGWLSGLKDPSIGRALSAIHNDPSRKWTVEALAELAGLSRSGFAARFAEIAGQTPLRYLATWRLDLAADQLRSGTLSIAEIAAAVGYASESALTRAFKAQFGTTPAAFRKAAVEEASTL